MADIINNIPVLELVGPEISKHEGGSKKTRNMFKVDVKYLDDNDKNFEKTAKMTANE